jgi:L-ascorbate metabolism protein UlaG (beta-lactamase superfamily)
MLALLAFAMLVVGCDDGLVAYRAHMVAAPAPTTSPRVTATWLGTAGVLLSDGETRILIDPFVSRSSLAAAVFRRPISVDDAAVADWIDRIGAQGTQAVLVSHSHYDHAMDAPDFARRLGALLVGSESTLNIGRGAGLGEDRLLLAHVGEAVTIGTFRVTFLESRHGPALLGRIPYPGEITGPLRSPATVPDYKLGGAYSLRIEHALGTILHHGSAGWVDAALKGVRADVVLLGVAGRRDTEEYLTHVVDAVGARRVVPIHFDNFFAPLDEPLETLIGVDFAEFMAGAAAHTPALTIETWPIGAARVVLPAPGGL